MTPGTIRPGPRLFRRGNHVARRSFLAALVGALLVSAALAVGAGGPVTAAELVAAADQQRPLDLVKVSVARVLTILRAQPAGTPLTSTQSAEVRRVADDFFDFDEMARRTLANHWRDLSPREQSEFTALFIDVLEQSYLTVIRRHSVTAVTFQGEIVTGSLAQVRSRIITDRQVELLIEYRLLQSGGRWQAYDVVADGVSLLSSYRSQFNTIIQASSFAQLLTRLRTREAHVLPAQRP